MSSWSGRGLCNSDVNIRAWISPLLILNAIRKLKLVIAGRCIYQVADQNTAWRLSVVPSQRMGRKRTTSELMAAKSLKRRSPLPMPGSPASGTVSQTRRALSFDHSQFYRESREDPLTLVLNS